MTTVSEAAGAIASPIGAAKLPNVPYLNAIKKIPLKKAASYGSFYGTGTAENKDTFGETLGNYAENMGLGAISGGVGNWAGSQFFGRSYFPILRNGYEQVSDIGLKQVYNYFRDKK